MNIPNCYDPAGCEEQRQKRADQMRSCLRSCALCGETLLPGMKYREARFRSICEFCFDQLAENEETVETE